MSTGNHSRNDNPSLSGSEEPPPKRPRESPHHVIKREYHSSEEHFTSEGENYGGNHHFKTEQSDSYDHGGSYQDYHGQDRGSHHYEETVSPPPEERVLPSSRAPAPSMDLLKALNKKSSRPPVPQSLLHKSQPLYPERPARPTGYPRHLPRHFEESHGEYDDGYTFRGRDESRWKGEGYDYGPDNEYDDYGQDYDGYGYGERQGDSYHQEETEYGENDYGFYDDGSYDDRPPQNYGGRSSYGDEPRFLPPKSSRYPQGLRGGGPPPAPSTLLGASRRGPPPPPSALLSGSGGSQRPWQGITYQRQSSNEPKPLLPEFENWVHESNIDQAKFEPKIIDFLKQFTRPVATLEITKSLGKMAKRDINPILYDMENRGIIRKVTRQPPSWKLNPNAGSGTSFTRISLSPAKPQEFSFSSRSVTQASRLPPPPHTSLSSARPRMPQPQQSKPPITAHRPPSRPRALLPMNEASQAPKPQPSQAPKSQPPLALSGVTFAALSKNPVSVLNEYAQKNKMEAVFEILNEARGGKNKFLVAAKIGNKMYSAVSAPNIKESRKEAADVALREILAQSEAAGAQLTGKPGRPLTHFDQIAGLSHHAFLQVAHVIQEKFAGRKVVACIIMKTYEESGRAVCLATGNRCITGDRISLEGKAINDSHAEILCRRAFIRFLYSEIEKFYDREASIFKEGGMGGRLQLKDGVEFHLYISTAPCGDGALFSPREGTNVNPNAATAPRDHSPTFSSKQQGLLRTKVEDGEGTIPINPREGPQTWDGIRMGKRLRTMSCSDKVCRWNVLGMQGALLSHLIEPIYLESLTLGYLYDHGHLSRSSCCRLSHQSDIDEVLPLPYALNHPWIGRVMAYDPPRETGKTNNLSVNWVACETNAELTDGRTGACLTRTSNAPTPSRLCKAMLYQRFRGICSKAEKLKYLLEFETYREAKERADDFQKAKEVMFKQFRKSKYGTWVTKPREQELFSA